MSLTLLLDDDLEFELSECRYGADLELLDARALPSSRRYAQRLHFAAIASTAWHRLFGAAL
jgi:hypothetical protein